MPRCRTDSEHRGMVAANFRIRNFPQLKVAVGHLKGKGERGNLKFGEASSAAALSLFNLEVFTDYKLTYQVISEVLLSTVQSLKGNPSQTNIYTH